MITKHNIMLLTPFSFFRNKSTYASKVKHYKYSMLIYIVFSYIFPTTLYAATAYSIEDGINAFKQGNYVKAREVFMEYVGSGIEAEGEVQLYLLAMKESVPLTRPASGIIETTLRRSKEEDPYFRILEAKLHFFGCHPESSIEKGLGLITNVTKDDRWNKMGYG